MANFIDSSKILMYPSAFRAVNPESYLNTEFNLTNTKRLSSYKELNSYIINRDDYYVNFCINGYFFKIKYLDLMSLNLKPLYAYIILRNEDSQDVRVTDRYNNLRLTVVNPGENTESIFGVLDIYNELRGLAEFRGLAFTDSIQTIVDLEVEAESKNEFEIHHLQLLDSEGEVVGNKFKLSSLEIRNSFDIDKSIYEYFNTGNLGVREKLTAKDAEITNNLTVNNETSLNILSVSGNATLEKDLTLKGALNGAKISGDAQVTFEQEFKGLNSTIDSSSISNATINVDGSGITLANYTSSKSLNLPFNPSGTGSKVLVNTAGSSSWITLSNTAAESSVVYRDANGDTAVRNLDTAEINAKKIYLKDISFPNNKGEVTYALSLAYDSSNKKNYIKLSNLQKSFSAGVTTNEISDATPTPNNFISSVSVAEDGSMKFSSTGLTVASSTALGAVKIGYTESGQNYPVELNDSNQMYVNVPWENYYHTPKYSSGLNIADGTGRDALYVPKATADSVGLVKPAAVRASTTIAPATGNTTDGRYYGVEMDRNGKLFVNVPWSYSDTTYGAGAGLSLDTNTDMYNVNTNFTSVPAARLYKTLVDADSDSLYTAIPVATDVGYGVVKVGFGDQNASRFYGVKLTDDNQMYVNVPWADNHVTSAAGHYNPSADSSSTISRTASGGSSLTRGSSNVVTGVTISRDSKGHITDVSLTSGKLPSSDNTQANIYATTSSGTSNVAENTVNPYISLIEGNTCRNRIQIQGDATTTTGSGLRVYANNGIIYIKGPALTAGTTQGQFSYAGSTVSLSGLQTTSIPTFNGMSLNGALNVKSSIYIKDSSNTTKVTISNGGTVTATSFTSGSDIRIKENIEEFKYTKSILDLPIKKFDYIDGPKNQIGCIAQDLQKLYPELVKEDDEGYLSINESKLVYLLIEEVKQLKKELKQVKNDVLFLLN